MKLKTLKYKIKNIPFIGNTYQLLIGNRKIKREQNLAKQRLQKYGIDLLTQIESTLDSFTGDFLYFADYGTLLGIVRDHNFIGWDMDVDYAVILNEDFDWVKFENHLRNNSFKKVREYQYKSKIKEQTYEYKGLTIDIFFKTDDGENSIAYGFYKKEDYRYDTPYERHVNETKYIRILKTRKEAFKGIHVTVPENAEAYLENIYSKSWHVPNPEWSGDDQASKITRPLDTLGIGYFDE